MIFKQKQPQINIKTPQELEGMRRAGRLASQCLQQLTHAVRPGMTTQDLDDMIVEFARAHGARSATLGYRGYPKSVCTSINEEICHGIPSVKRVLREGDIVGVDVTLIVDGFYGDNASTVPVGQVSDADMSLMWVTMESLRLAIEAVKAGKRLGDIGHAIQACAEPLGFSVVRDFVGHGIGRRFHEEPQVPHVGKMRTGLRLRPGMTFTIEPMINAGTWRMRVLEDQWTAVTRDGQRSAQYEHTIAVTEQGAELLTVQNDQGVWEPPGRFEILKPESLVCPPPRPAEPAHDEDSLMDEG